jgi:hypothetical protein
LSCSPPTKAGAPASNAATPVRIKDGPFRDMVGIFDGPSEPSQRVRVLLNAMRNSMRVRLPVSALEKASQEEGYRAGKPPRRSRGRGRPIRS